MTVRTRMCRAEAVQRICDLLRSRGEASVPQIAVEANVNRSVTYSVVDELIESGELSRRREDGVWLYRLVWQEPSSEVRTVLRECRRRGVQAQRVRHARGMRIAAASPLPGETRPVWLDEPEDVEFYLADQARTTGVAA